MKYTLALLVSLLIVGLGKGTASAAYTIKSEPSVNTISHVREKKPSITLFSPSSNSLIRRIDKIGYRYRTQKWVFPQGFESKQVDFSSEFEINLQNFDIVYVLNFA